MSDLKETVSITRPVAPHIADLVRFAQRIGGRALQMSNEELIAAAKAFYEEQHGED